MALPCFCCVVVSIRTRSERESAPGGLEEHLPGQETRGVRGTFAGGGRQGPGAGDSGGGEEAGRFAPRRGAEEAVRHVAAAVHVDRRRQGRGRGRLHQRRRLLRAARGVHGAGRPAQEPARGRLPHHHQAAEGFLAPGLTIVE
uniref:Uncharacterized protein n=1 Tax=Zea mays TaxID=4577 RepID=A0A804R9Y4_MAIZE